MADYMTFPDKFEDFIKRYEFKDDQEIYTNGAELIPSFRVMQAWEHYTDNLKANLNNIYECINIINNNLYSTEEEIE